MNVCISRNKEARARLAPGWALALAIVLIVGVAPAALAVGDGALLEDLQLTSGALVQPFTPTNTTYFAVVPETVPAVAVQATAVDASAELFVSVNGEPAVGVDSGELGPALPLEIGNNVIAIRVVAADGTEETYRIHVPRNAVRFQEGAGGYVGTADTQINQAVRYVDHNLGGQHKFEVGYSGPWARDQKYALVRFDHLPLPDGAVVTEATLNLWYYADRAGMEIVYPEKEVYLHRVVVPWNEGGGGTADSDDGSPAEAGEVTWNTFMDVFEPYEFRVTDYVMVGTEPSWYSFDVTRLVTGWLDGTFPNYGVLLKTFEYSSNDDERMIGTKQFRSREHDIVEERPYLSIVYTAPLTGVTVDVHTLQLTSGGTPLTVTAFPRPLNAEYESVQWVSTDETVVTVVDGVVTPVGAGDAVVRVAISDSAASHAVDIPVVVQ